jgi:hypothetical protein
MSILSLNFRGAGNASTVKEPCDFVTKLVSSLCFDHAFVVSSAGRSGGLGMFWNNEIRIDILGYSQYHIDTSVLGLGSNQ